jgi:hypothetical protein
MSAERQALIRLANTQRHLSWKYRSWALEDQAAGKLDSYRKNIREAERLRRDARWHLDYARNLTWH